MKKKEPKVDILKLIERMNPELISLEFRIRNLKSKNGTYEKGALLLCLINSRKLEDFSIQIRKELERRQKEALK